jgi:hypothetical protein
MVIGVPCEKGGIVGAGRAGFKPARAKRGGLRRPALARTMGRPVCRESASA